MLTEAAQFVLLRMPSHAIINGLIHIPHLIIVAASKKNARVKGLTFLSKGAVAKFEFFS
jgi:hypothetical protein